VLAISPQDVDSHQRFAEQEGFTFPILADTDGAVAKQYGVQGGSRVQVKRSIFAIDSAGVLRWRFVGAIRAIFKKPRDLAKVLDAMPTP
jgi:thioredoxin-dependent peroxiredoxin